MAVPTFFSPVGKSKKSSLDIYPYLEVFYALKSNSSCKWIPGVYLFSQRLQTKKRRQRKESFHFLE